MSIRPIDIMKSQEVTQYKQAENQRSQHEQVHISKNFQTMIKEERTKTKEMQKSDNNEYRYDEKKQGNNGYQSSSKKKKKQEEDKKKDAKNQPIQPGGFDVLI